VQSAASTASRFDTTGLPWVRPDGVALVDTAADMFGGAFWRAPLSMSVDGQPFPGGDDAYWAGDPNAIPMPSDNCQNWSQTDADGTAGDGDETSALRFNVDMLACGSSTVLNLLCLEQ